MADLAVAAETCVALGATEHPAYRITSPRDVRQYWNPPRSNCLNGLLD
jgi:hypothetical protein